ncbi:MAG: RsmE family RNA methyltransferase [bacterium]|nr:RsmE family RNA methyltransferase [bacterium]
MEYYFTDRSNIDEASGELVVDEFEFNHLIKVLRKKTGDEITITDGERNIYHCVIAEISKDKLHCKIISREFNLYEPGINLKLYLSLLRNMSRFEFAIEKAVELGVSSIHPVITEHTVNKTSLSSSKMNRIRKIIMGAMGQSQRCLLTEFKETITFQDFISGTKQNSNKIVMYEYSEDISEIDLEPNTNDVSLLIGPEGGFSEKEISILKNNNWQVRSLGERKLRAETAAIISAYNLITKQK